MWMNTLSWYIGINSNECQKYSQKTYFSRYILVHSSCHRGTADPDQNQYREDKSCSEDPPRQPWVPVRTRLHDTHAFDCQNWYRVKSINFFLGNAETAMTTLKGSWISCSRYRSCGQRSCLCLSPGLKHGGILWKLGCSILGLEDRNNKLAERVCLYLNTLTPKFSLLV